MPHSVMEHAYLKASANGRLPAHARQIMYAARGYIQQHADRELGHKFDQYFTQQLLPEYIETYGVIGMSSMTPAAISPSRIPKRKSRSGPTRCGISRDPAAQGQRSRVRCLGEFYPTLGPKHRFGAILFIEKEGFMPLFEAVQLAERYDLAIMSTKGMSVTAARSWSTSCVPFMPCPFSFSTISTRPDSRSSALCNAAPGATVRPWPCGKRDRSRLAA